MYCLAHLVQLTLPYVQVKACSVLHRDLKTDNAIVARLAPVVVKWSDFRCSVKLATAGRGAGPSTSKG